MSCLTKKQKAALLGCLAVTAVMVITSSSNAQTRAIQMASSPIVDLFPTRANTSDKADLAAIGMVVSANYGVVVATVANLGDSDAIIGRDYTLEITESGKVVGTIAGRLPAISAGKRHNATIRFKKSDNARVFRFAIDAAGEKYTANNAIQKTFRAGPSAADLAAEIIVDPRRDIVSGYIRNVGDKQFNGQRSVIDRRFVGGKHYKNQTVILHVAPGQRQLVFRQKIDSSSSGRAELSIQPADANASNDVASTAW